MPRLACPVGLILLGAGHKVWEAGLVTQMWETRVAFGTISPSPHG
jgi:hypothetical protein